MATTFFILDDEVLVHVLSFLSPTCLAICGSVDRRLQRLSQTGALWRAHAEAHAAFPMQAAHARSCRREYIRFVCARAVRDRESRSQMIRREHDVESELGIHAASHMRMLVREVERAGGLLSSAEKAQTSLLAKHALCRMERAEANRSYWTLRRPASPPSDAALSSAALDVEQHRCILTQTRVELAHAKARCKQIQSKKRRLSDQSCGALIGLEKARDAEAVWASSLSEDE
uniref:F-box domain-containing protein n=1 Tax=Coccolithus braarudii TaxID=221442 RepID=A0A7S0Q600_9EUKA|mmetsp:Transcript_40833/g.87111  ORF Transcript_40833/g.87111 Transcript_40833/m.87111 type:complete len:231 (+) Transcript_40833:133-825(+)